MIHTPTDEQQQALGKFYMGGTLAIEAGAGTGKTATLEMLARSSPGKRGQYVVFNAALKEDASRRFPNSVRCHTAHGLAMAAVGKDYRHRLNSSQRVKSWELAAMLGIEGIHLDLDDGRTKRLSPTFLAGATMRAVTNFCQSDALEPTHMHVQRIEGIDEPGSWERNRLVAQHLLPYVRKAWADATNMNGRLPYKHDYYLKQWHLEGPLILSDYILFDEAQDANPVIAAIVAAQGHRAQLVHVGDSQQQIYSFTGAVNALARVQAEHRTYLTLSFRFGPAIAEVANVVLAQLEAPLRLRGKPTISSQVQEWPRAQCVLTRTNAMAVREVLGHMADGGRPHLVGGGGDIQAFMRGARDLQEGRRTDHYELACFESWAEVQEYVQFDEQGDDLRLLVELVDRFGVNAILRALSGCVPEKDASLVVSTAHKAKGREWPTVRLAPDFPEQPDQEELRLLYVACTRAQHVLDVANVRYLQRLGVAA